MRALTPLQRRVWYMLGMSDKRQKMPPSLLQLTFKWTYQGQQCRNVIYWGRYAYVAHAAVGPADWTDDSAITMATQAAEWYKNCMENYVSNKASNDAVDYVWNEDPDAPLLHEGSDNGANTPWTGLLTGIPLPTNVTLAVKLGTGFGGRANHGRFYYVGITEDLIDSPNFSQLKPGSVTDLSAAFDSLLSNWTWADIDGDGNGYVAQPVVASFIVPGSSSGGSAGVYRNPTSYKEVTTITMTDPVLDSQRNRLPGRGA